MIIKSSATIRQNYNEISELCKKTKEPVFPYKKRRRGSDGQGYSVSEVVRMMNNEINEANGDEKQL